MESNSKENLNRYTCSNCGADMVFDPKVGKLACPYCGSKKAIQTNPSEVIERNFSNFLRPEAERLQPLAKDAMQVTCQSCGATVTFIPPTTSTSCDFCGEKIVAQPKVADPLVAPEGVLPFSVTNKQAIASLKSWTSTRWFAPNALKTMARHDKAESVYIPFWTFDADATTDYTGKRGEDYSDTEYYTDSEGKRKSRTVTKTRWYDASGRVFRNFDDVPIPASTSVLPNYLDRLNYDFGELTSYDPGYLSGHKAQTYQVSLEDGFEKFKLKISPVIINDCENDIGGDRQRVQNTDTEYDNVTFKHILVPVYAGAYKLNNKAYQIIINGRTGEVQGERPYSWLKIGCLVTFILAAITIFIIIASLIKS